MGRSPYLPPALAAFALLMGTNCGSRVEAPSASPPPSVRAPANVHAPAAPSCAAWKSGSYLAEITGAYPLRFAPGDTVAQPEPAFAESFPVGVSSRVTARVGDETYVLVFTEDRGDAAHLFVFQELAGRYCVAGIWETTFGGNGVRSQVKSLWTAPNGQRLLVLVRSTSLSRGYWYDRKPGEPCASDAAHADDDHKPDPTQCQVDPEFDAYFNVLSLDTRAHRLRSVYSSDQEGFGRHQVSGYDDGYDGEPRFVLTPSGLALDVDGSVDRWNDAEGRFEATESSRSLPE